MKLNLGSGGINKDGYLNIDYAHIDADIAWDLNVPLEIPNNTVEEIIANHVFEHLHRHGLEAVVYKWYEILVVGGRLIMELPNFDGLIQMYIDGNEQTALEWIYGNQSRVGQFHHWGWNEKRLATFLEQFGFYVRFETPLDYHTSEGPCLRVIATKK